MTCRGPSLFIFSSSWILVKAVVRGMVTQAAVQLPTQPAQACTRVLYVNTSPIKIFVIILCENCVVIINNPVIAGELSLTV